jgi:hypothetical protein
VFVPCGTLAQLALSDNDAIVRDVQNAGTVPACTNTSVAGRHSADGQTNDKEGKKTVNHQRLPLVTIS